MVSAASPKQTTSDAGWETAPLVSLRNRDTGASVDVPASALQRPKELRRRVRLADPQASLAPTDGDITIDAANKKYWMKTYPSVGTVLLSNAGVPAQLGFLRGALYVVLGAFFLAGAAQVTFLFPCIIGYTSVSVGTNSYCVANGAMSQVTPGVSCPAAVCGSARIPVTMQTYAVLLNGAVAGASGTWATVLYVAMVCVGAPFGAASGGHGTPMWKKGAIISPSGGFFWGFIAASAIMARCAAKGHDRPRSAYWMVLWMFAAEAAIYACGLFWLPFGLAIQANVSPAKICPSGAQLCLNNVFNWGFTPFVPGESSGAGCCFVSTGCVCVCAESCL